MREEDRQEIWHLARIKPYSALTSGFQECSYNRTILLDGKVVAIFGVGGEKGGEGHPWMLASDLLTKIRKPFVRECHAFVQEMSQNYTKLTNCVWSKNKEHIRWLKWLGFTFLPGVPLGPDQEIFYPFYKVT